MRCHVFCPFEFMIFMALKHIGQFEMLKNLRGSKTFDLKIKLTPATEYVLKIYRIL
uniref:Uncharacterized protein n=1 Tax=Aegilops tauschii subsp. strangulata TaxID=200361 RepID=A0A453L2K5_AEGTS